MKKKLFYLLAVGLLMVSCQEETPENYDVVPSKGKGITKVGLIGTYSINSGNLYVYKYENDTIFIAEGRTGQYPVSISVK